MDLQTLRMDLSALPIHGIYCFHALHAHLSHTNSKDMFVHGQDKVLALFVTWKRQDKLCGCIGTLRPSAPLKHTLAHFAVQAATRDSRFTPISLEQLSHLSCTVSLLTNFEEVSSPYDWTPGTHGITIKLSRDPSKTATFLPEVCVEQEWTQTECLQALVRKSGYKGVIGQHLLDSLLVTRYVSSQISVTFQDYEKFMQN